MSPKPPAWANGRLVRPFLKHTPGGSKQVVRRVQFGENATFKVKGAKQDLSCRIYRPGRWTKKEILLEHRFIEILEKELIVPKPLANQEGETLFSIEAHHTYLSFAPWLEGRDIGYSEPTDDELEMAGVLFAKMHLMTRKVSSKGETRIWDQSNLLDLTLENFQGLKKKLFPKTHGHIEEKLKQVLSDLAQKLSDTDTNTQLCHADLHWGNLLVQGREMVPIDFDDCGWSTKAYDLAVLTYASRRKILSISEMLSKIEIVLKGYQSISKDYPKKEEVFLYELVRAIWLLGWIIERPDVFSLEQMRKRIEIRLTNLRKYLDEF